MLRGIFRLTILSTFFLLLISLTLGAPAHAQGPNGPDFSSVTDLLQGRRTLFPSDDIVVSTGPFFAFGNQSANTYILQSSSGNVDTTISYPVSNTIHANALVNSVSRMFTLSRDVVVTVAPGVTNLDDQLSGFNQNFVNTVQGFPQYFDHPTNKVSADFTGDGYADLAFLSQPQGGIELDTITAANVNDLSQGFFYGTPLALPSAAEGGALAAGDFNGDGTSELALAYINNGGITVTLYEPQVTTDANGNVTALSWKLLVTTTINAGTQSSSPVALVAGNFSGLANPQLMLTYSTFTNQVFVQPITVGATSNPLLFTLNLGSLLTLNQTSDLYVTARAGYLDFFSNTEQLVLMLQTNDHQILDVITFDNQLIGTLASSFNTPQNGDAERLNFAIGNFDQPQTESSPLSLQIAALWEPGSAPCGGQGNLAVQI